MLINLIPNEEIKLDKELAFKTYENTLNIVEVAPVKIKGDIYISHTTIEYNLDVKTAVVIDDPNNHCKQKKDLIFEIKETDEISAENSHIIEKTLDLNAKIWENIVVEIFSESSSYNNDLISGDGWALYQEEQVNDEVDERLAPLLELLNKNEEV